MCLEVSPAAWCEAPLEMNEGTHWGKGTRGLEKAAVPKKTPT